MDYKILKEAASCNKMKEKDYFLVHTQEVQPIVLSQHFEALVKTILKVCIVF